MPAPTFTYEFAPASIARDFIRCEIQDTDIKAPLLADQEIESFIILEAGPGFTIPEEIDLLRAAAKALEVLARRFAAQADTVIGSLHSTYSRTAKVYDERAKDLRKRVSGMHAPFVGGQSESGKAALALNEDRVQDAFTRKQFTNPWRGSPTGPGPVIPGEGPL